MIRVLLADDQALVRDGLRLILDLEDDIDVVAEAADGETAVKEVLRLRPDVALLDVNLRDGLVVPVAERLAVMGVPFVLVTARDAKRLAEPLLQTAPALGKPVDERELRLSLARLIGPP